MAEREADRMHVFVYGTLTDPDRLSTVLADAPGAARDDWRVVGDATLRGLHRVDGRFPTLAPGGTVEGRVVETSAIGALDSYEGVDHGLYVRVPVPIADQYSNELPGDVAVYVGDPDRLDATEHVPWPGDGDLDARVREYVNANDVSVTLDASTGE